MGKTDKTIYNGTIRQIMFRTRGRDIILPAGGSVALNASEFGMVSASRMYRVFSDRRQVSTRPYKMDAITKKTSKVAENKPPDNIGEAHFDTWPVELSSYQS